MTKRILLGIALVFILIPFISAQNSNDAREVTTKYFIKNAFVVQKPGSVLSNASILIEDGLIKSVGTGISAPYDAKIIDADSMYVYPAFIDACSHAGIAKPERGGDRPSVSNPGNPPKKLAGITPQTTVRASMEKVDNSIKDLKKEGFGYVHVVPRGRMLPGMGSILSTSGNSVASTVIKENVSQYAQFSPARRMRPGTTIGVMSQFRDLMQNAKNGSKYESLYASNPTGLQRPEKSEELEALYDVSNGKMPVFFNTPKVKDVNRAIILDNELDFDLVLTNVQQGWPLLSKIKKGNYKVVLGLDLPDEVGKGGKGDKKGKGKGKGKGKKEMKEDGEKMDKEAKMKKEDKKKKEKEKEMDPEKKEMLEKRKKSYAEYVGQASTFDKNGINFSFSTLGVKSKDIKGNLKRMIDAGLSEDKALAALTTNPAQLLGISSMAGSIEKGKIGNLFITDKPYFDEESKIKFVFNDGTYVENKEKKKKKKDESPEGGEVNMIGDWSYEVEIPGQVQDGTMKISGDKDEPTVSLNSSDDPTDFIDGTNVSVDGNSISFDLTVEGQSFSISLDFEGESFEGTLSLGEFGSFPMTGDKNPE